MNPLECYQTTEERLQIARASIRKLERKTAEQSWQIADLRNALRAIYRRSLESGDLALATFTHDVAEKLDCNPEMLRKLEKEK